jgi:chlorite dismutase
MTQPEVEEIKKEFEKTFVRGEISALIWCSTMRSISIAERNHLQNRIKQLEKFLRGEIPADKDGTKSRPVPDFQDGEK